MTQARNSFSSKNLATPSGVAFYFTVERDSVRLIFDIETNGLLNTVSTIHCLVIKNVDTGEVQTFLNPKEPIAKNIADGLKLLQQASMIAGHNVIKFDLPVIQKLYPWFTYDPAKVIDTMVCTRLIWSHIKEIDAGLMKKGTLPGKLFGSHSLAAWGHRMGIHKGDYTGGWEECNDEMVTYCEQDVEVTAALFNKIESKEYSLPAIELEHQVAFLMAQQERNGFCFNEAKAAELYAKLSQRRADLERELKEFFGSWEVRLPDFVPARDNKTQGYKKGVPVKRTKIVEFNPSSRDHIADRLTQLYGWKPTVFTDGGKPKVDETVISSLDYPPCKPLGEYLMVQKRISQLAEGDQAWLKLAKDGKIHGSVNPNGAVTGRATHAYPNISQVPSSGAPYGPECRELFRVPDGWTLVGADASGLELRCLAHFMAKYDGGQYGQELLTGDIHTLNQQAAGLETRPQAKTFIYAFLYGAGDAKIGSIVGGTEAEGKKLKSRFLAKTPALKRLKEAVTAAAKRGFLIGLDGRSLHVRSAHSALNTLLQSAGALVCKKWLVILEEHLDACGYKHGWDGDYAFCAWSHDEVQIACRTQEVADYVSKFATKAVSLAGEYFNFRCPLAGESKMGTHWGETH
jgi:DNA polymerase I